MIRPQGRDAHDALWLRAGLAFVWLATGVGVLHPDYRRLGAEYLAPLGLSPWVMVVTCVGEIALGLRVLFGRMDAWLALVQAALIVGFTAILTATQPSLWLHPLGPLSKNLPLLAIIGVLWRLDRTGWDAPGERLLRWGMTVVWLADGAAWIVSGPSPTMRLLGGLAMVSGVAALALRGRPRHAVLAAQAAALAAVPIVASFVDPLLWVHPFGPLTKNVPLVIGTWIACRGVRPLMESPAHDAR